jgi:hypothetical protein
LCVSARPCLAEPFLRYALIVGDNQGRTDTDTRLEPLRHAESEAAALRDVLVHEGGFPSSSDRVVLLQGKGRTEILAAAARLANQHRQDRARFGQVRTMFAFFFTGHGLEGKLLTADGPLTGADVGQIFKEVGATFSLGLFDACFSGSLDFSALRAKGLRTPRSFDVFISCRMRCSTPREPCGWSPACPTSLATRMNASAACSRISSSKAWGGRDETTSA